MSSKPLPFVLSIPHAGLMAPPEAAGALALDEAALYNECDLWAEQLFDFAHADLAAAGGDNAGRGALATVTAPVARAIVDVNRPPDDLDDPDGPVKTRTSYGAQVYANIPAPTLRLALRDRYWHDFHRRLGQALAAAQDHVVLLLDCHNMAQTGPSHYAHPGQPRPLICLANLGDDDGEPIAGAPTTCSPGLLRQAGKVAASLFADMSLLEPAAEPPPAVALNYPFAGGYIIRRYGSGRHEWNAGDALAPRAIMVEVNRGLFVGNQTADSPVKPMNRERVAAIRLRLYRWALALSEMIEAENG